jgi:hypothetical protein
VDETGQAYAYTGDDPLNATDPLGLAAGLNPRVWTSKTVPKVRNWKLERYLKALYQDTDRTPGGTAAALREEALTGKPVGKGFHDVKGSGIESGLQDLLEQNKLPSRTDRLVARATLSDLAEAQFQFDAAAEAERFSVGSGSGQLSSARFGAAVERFQATIAQTAIGVDSANPTVSFDDGSDPDPDIIPPEIP